MNEPFAFYQQSADYVRARMPFEPQIAVRSEEHTSELQSR